MVSTEILPRSSRVTSISSDKAPSRIEMRGFIATLSEDRLAHGLHYASQKIRRCERPPIGSFDRLPLLLVLVKHQRPQLDALAGGCIRWRGRIDECGVRHKASAAIGCGIVAFQQQRF